MDNFDLKKYLAEGKLLKEEMSLDAFLKNQLAGIEGKTEGIETVEKEEWKNSLDSALEYYISTEEYEECSKIKNLIEKL